MIAIVSRILFLVALATHVQVVLLGNVCPWFVRCLHNWVIGYPSAFIDRHLQPTIVGVGAPIALWLLILALLSI